jgi:hypothetical protein
MEEDLKKLQEAIEEKLKLAASKKEIETIKSEMEAEIKKIKVGISEDELKAAKAEFDEKLKAQWQAVEAKLKTVDETKPMTFGEQLKKAFVDAGLIEQAVVDGVTVERVKWDRDTKNRIDVKLAVDMNTANTIAGVSQGFQGSYTMLPQELPLSTDMHMYDVFGHSPLGEKDYFGVVIEGTETDGAAIKPETSAAGDSSYLITTTDYKKFDYGVKFRVHENMLNNWAGLMNRIQTIGLDRLKSKISTYVLGSGGNNTSVPYGLTDSGKFTAYDTTLRQNEVANANLVDVIKNAVLQAENSELPVNAVMLNPNDIAYIESLKDGNDNMVRLAGLVVDATGRLSYIYGLRVIRSKKVTANTFFLVNTFESVQFGDKYGFRVRMGYDKDSDFSKNIITIQPEVSLAIGLGNPLSIIYCSDITAAEAALNA